MRETRRPCVLTWLVVLTLGVCSSAPRTLEAELLVRGDVNVSGGMDLSDGITIFGFLFLGDPVTLLCEDAADTNDSGVVDLSDGITILNFLFTGAAPPSPPFPFCGNDLTDDGLGCESFDLCVDDELFVTLDRPANQQVFRAAAIDVGGTVAPQAVSVEVNGTDAEIVDGSYTARGVPLVEGTNILVATARNRNGVSVSATVSVLRDTRPPLVVFETPRDGDRLVTETIDVAGTVNDIIPGATVNADDVFVEINGVPAAVNNRTFFLPGVALEEGENVLTAEAIDRAGNRSGATIRVTREPDLAGIRILITGGSAQSAPIGTTLPEPLSVHVELDDGSALPDRPLMFAVSRGDGLLGDPQEYRRSVTLLADQSGDASIPFTLGTRTGEGLHRVRVTTPGSLTFAELCATAEPNPPATIAYTMLPRRQGVAGQRLSDRLSVILTDDGGNPAPDHTVVFSVVRGGGNFGGKPVKNVVTNADGIAEADWILGPEPGIDNNEATANFEDNEGLPVSFVVSALEVGPPEETRVSGMVQDSSAAAIVGARAEIVGTELFATTGADGNFTITDVEPGGHRVRIAGSAANDPDTGTYFPDIDFAVEVISGVDNQLDQIVVLPFLDMDGEQLVGGDEDVTLTMDGVPGFSITVLAGSVILPDGTRGSAMMSSSPVKLDKVPMPPPQGATPLTVGTLQPVGYRFDPPARVCYPNVVGLAPGDVADVFAFHHDIGQFVNIGPGTVTEDGSRICSDPGFGIVQSGWHCVIRVPGQSVQCTNCKVTIAADAPRDACVDKEVTFRATGTPAGGAYSWSGGTAVGSTTSASYTTKFSSTGTKTVTVRYTCTRDGESRTAIDSVDLNVVRVELQIKGTAAEDDDITLYNPGTAAQSFAQRMTARVVITGGPATVELSIDPPANATVAPASVTRTSNVTITPTGRSGAANDTNLVAKVNNVECAREDFTIVGVTLPPNIRRANTPVGMRDRIPPRVDTALRVEVTPNLAGSGQSVTLATTDASAHNGNLTIDGAATADITTTGNVDFRGSVQTTPGNNSNLRVVAQVCGADTIRTPGFSVAAIPVNWMQTAWRDGGAGVIIFDYSWGSDSGNLADLDQVWVGEHVTYSDGGMHAGAGRPWRGNNPDPTILPGRGPGVLAPDGLATDTHSPPGGLPRPGPVDSYTATQNYGFHDYRTDNTPDDGSLGWQIPLVAAITISRFVEFIAPTGRWQYRITKSGQAVRANLP